MISVQPKTFDKLFDSLKERESLFLLGCGGCPVGCDCGGEPELAKLETDLAKSGKQVAGTQVIDFLCNKVLVGQKLSRKLEELKDADCIVVVSCGIGVQAAANMVDMPCYPALDTQSVGGLQGLWPSNERCAACGDCVLDRTGGICPMTTCAKALLNGQCGGSHDGKCEVEEERDCGWHLIYERLKELGQLDNLLADTPPKDYRKYDIPKEWRTTSRWALEVDE